MRLTRNNHESPIKSLPNSQTFSTKKYTSLCDVKDRKQNMVQDFSSMYSWTSCSCNLNQLSFIYTFWVIYLNKYYFLSWLLIIIEMVNTWKDEIFINTETNIIIPIVIIAPIFINLRNQNGCKYYVNHNKNFKTY